MSMVMELSKRFFRDEKAAEVTELGIVLALIEAGAVAMGHNRQFGSNRSVRFSFKRRWRSLPQGKMKVEGHTASKTRTLS